MSGEIPANDFPAFVMMTLLTFASNLAFTGMSREDFEVYVTGLPSIILQNLDTSAHEES